MELTYLLNENVSALTFDATELYMRLPFAKRNITDYIVSETPIYSGNDLQQPRLLYCANRWLLYFSIDGASSSKRYALSATNPCGDWSLVTNDDGTPKVILSRTETWEDETYGIGGTIPIRTRHFKNGTGYNYICWYTYKDESGSYKTACCHSTDAINWTGKEKVVFDDTITSKVSSHQYINSATFDNITKTYYAVLASSVPSSFGNNGFFIKSNDGINWTYVGYLPCQSSFKERGEDTTASSLIKFGNLWVALTCGLDTSEGCFSSQSKNMMVSYSANGKIWHNDIIPMLQPTQNPMKDVSIGVGNNSLYFVWSNGNEILLSRIELSHNPPVRRSIGAIGANSSKSLSSYISGDKKDCLMIVKGTSSTSAVLSIEIVAVITDNQRTDFSKVTTEKHDISVDGVGNFVKAIKIDYLPHLFDIKVGSSASLTNIEFEIQG